MGKYDEYKEHWRQRAERERERRRALAVEARLDNLGAAYADFVRDVGEFLRFLEVMAEE